MKPVIPFHKPFTDRREAQALTVALQSGILRGDGPASKSIQQTLREATGAAYVYFTTSCTHALEIAILCLDLKPGDEVIMPSFTFVSTANAVLLHGGTPVFCDILPGTLNMDPADLERKITPRTRAVMPVHYGGVAADMNAISAIARRHQLYLIEDAAQGADAYLHDQHLGTIGDMGCLSFHDTKNITCGEGGAFLTNSLELARKAEIIREKGTNRSAFLRGEVDKYTWINKGSSFVQSDILAALLEVQWQKKDEIRQRRSHIWHTYHEALKPFEEKGLLSRPVTPQRCRSNYHTYFFLTDSASSKDSLLGMFRKNGISASFHYIPLHNSPFGSTLGTASTHLPVTESVSDRLIRLPLYPQLADEHHDFCERVVQTLNKFYHI